VENTLPRVGVDVVEIDPGVTEIAHRALGLPRDTAVRSYHMDGRQFIRERARKGHYQFVIQDAVNDLSVPYHLMTKEYNDAVKATLARDGAYLLTLIDSLRDGELWRAAMHTLRQSFAHVEVLDPSGFQDTAGRHVYVLYAADHPLPLAEVQAVAREAYLKEAGAKKEESAKKPFTQALDRARLDAFLQARPPIVLTDQYAPVDNLMAGVFRARHEGQ
jgi:spermidine synthase